MSEKKIKGQIKYPVYNVEEQMDFIVNLCKTVNFDPKQLITLILAEFICNLQMISVKSNQGYYKAFLSYIEHSNKIADDLKKLESEVKKNG